MLVIPVHLAAATGLVHRAPLDFSKMQKVKTTASNAKWENRMSMLKRRVLIVKRVDLAVPMATVPLARAAGTKTQKAK